MANIHLKDRKRAQKERLLFREISQLFLHLTLDDARLREITLSRLSLSPDKSMCTIYFYTPQGESYFKDVLEILKLYKPSLRKAIAEKIDARYTPELRFTFDSHYEKQERFEQLMEKIKDEGESS
ncbi:MAG: ribosome-binding factor A [Candidatus Babeliales bacterium]